MWSEQVPTRVGVTTAWCGHWNKHEAVRELLQNQFDAIAAKCGGYTLGESEHWQARKVCKTNEELGFLQGTMTAVYGSGQGQPEGYVLWVPSRSLLVLVNRRATLPANSLLVGSSGKRRLATPGLAGKHGEGLKAAAAVLMRESCRLELHQSRLALAFSKSRRSGALLSFVRKSHTPTPDEPRVPQIRLLLRMLKLELNVSRASDVITVISGLRRFEALDRYFLQRSHQAVSLQSQLRRPHQYLRLAAGVHGALLWPTGASGAPAGESVAKRVFVAGIFWEQKPNQKHYGVDFSASVSNCRDRTNISHKAYQKHMARIIDHLLSVPQVQDLILPVVLLELEQAQEGEDSHLHRLPGSLGPTSYQLLLTALKSKLVPPQRFLCPRTDVKKKLFRYATKENFYPTSSLLYDLVTTENGYFPDRKAMKKRSWEVLRASQPVRPGTALADVERKLREEVESVLEVSAVLLELRDTGDEAYVRDCKWSEEEGKLLVASSRLPAGAGGKWKLLKAIRSELKAMEKILGDASPPPIPAPSSTVSQITTSCLASAPSSPSSSSWSSSSSASASSLAPTPAEDSDSDDSSGDSDDSSGDSDDDLGDSDPEIEKVNTRQRIEEEDDWEDEMVEGKAEGIDTTQRRDAHSTGLELASSSSDHPALSEDSDGGDWTEPLIDDHFPAAPGERNAPRDAHRETLGDRSMRVQYRPLDDDDQVVDCTERGFERLRKAPKPQLAAILAGIRAVVDALGHPVAPAVCCVEYQFEAVFAAQSSTYSVNLWPLLHRAFTRRELFAYLVVLISHEVAHQCVPQAGHGGQHGRMTEDLVARALLKSDLAWAHESPAPVPPLVAIETVEEDDERPLQRRRRVTEPGPGRTGSLVSGTTAPSPAPQPAPAVGDKRKRG